MDELELTKLLRSSESETLDFKRDQYPFAGADQAAKSELLKDIVAFANSWKSSDAFILVGVEEADGRLKEVVGVDDILADHSVQQFVDSLTNNRVSFNIESFTYNGKQLMAVRIKQSQQRPIYLKQGYGKLSKESVYIRHGSSTAVATLDEIVDMVKADSQSKEASVILRLRRIQESSRNRWVPHSVSTEVDVLELWIENIGRTKATQIDGTLSIPESILLEHDVTKFLISERENTIHTVTVANFPIKPDPFGSLVKTKNREPILPSRNLLVDRICILPFDSLGDLQGCEIRWEVNADSGCISSGRAVLSDIVSEDLR